MVVFRSDPASVPSCSRPSRTSPSGGREKRGHPWPPLDTMAQSNCGRGGRMAPPGIAVDTVITVKRIFFGLSCFGW